MKEHPNIDLLLAQGMQALGLDHLPTGPFLDYLALLHKWNQAYNLTAVRSLQAMVTKHLLDSLAILPWIRGEYVLDAGTGAGLPGVIIALSRPELHVTLLDSNGKKIRFLREVKRVLGLKQVHIVQARVESYHPSHQFDTVTSRAFSELTNMIKGTRHLLAPEGRWLAMKGRCPEAELATVAFPYRVETYSVPGLQGERCCICIDNITEE